MMLQQGGVKIWRPRQVSNCHCGCCECGCPSYSFQIYVGAGKRDYVPLDHRVAVEGLGKAPTVIAHSG
jgi:citrate synthase